MGEESLGWERNPWDGRANLGMGEGSLGWESDPWDGRGIPVIEQQ